MSAGSHTAAGRRRMHRGLLPYVVEYAASSFAPDAPAKIQVELGAFDAQAQPSGSAAQAANARPLVGLSAQRQLRAFLAA